jgi:hypothetical protein
MPTDFEIAFANAKKQGLAQFSFNGKQYTTQLKEEPTKLFQVALTDKIKSEITEDPSLKYVSNFNTGLTQDEFNDYWKWANDRYKGQDNVLYEMGAYDLQGAWKDIKAGKIKFNPKTGHLPDTYKKPNHISFSDESMYHDGKKFQGGQWKQNGNKWTFKASPQTLSLYGKDYLQKYFKENEPDTDLIY